MQVLKRRALCVTELTSQLGISQSATSQHLRVLKDARIVKFQIDMTPVRSYNAVCGKAAIASRISCGENLVS